MAYLLLEPRMAVIPVGAVLDDWELVGEGGPWLDAREADAGHAVHVERQDEAVPVDGRVLIERVLDVDAGILPFTQTDEWGRENAVHRDRMAGAAADRERAVRDLEVYVRSEEHTSELPSLMRISYAVSCLTQKTTNL